MNWRVKALWDLAEAFGVRRPVRDQTYPKDPNPEHWKTINGSHVHMDKNGNYDGGAGGKFNGRHHYGPNWRQKAALMNRLTAALHKGIKRNNYKLASLKGDEAKVKSAEEIRNKVFPSIIKRAQNISPWLKSYQQEAQCSQSELLKYIASVSEADFWNDAKNFAHNRDDLNSIADEAMVFAMVEIHKNKERERLSKEEEKKRSALLKTLPELKGKEQDIRQAEDIRKNVFPLMDADLKRTIKSVKGKVIDGIITQDEANKWIKEAQESLAWMKNTTRPKDWIAISKQFSPGDWRSMAYYAKKYAQKQITKRVNRTNRSKKAKTSKQPKLANKQTNPKPGVIINMKKMYPVAVARAARGKPMNDEQANKGHANPNFIKGEPYRKNCQTCVVAYELRRRGYDVEAKGNNEDQYFSQLAGNPALAWIDPQTGKTPTPIRDKNVTTPLKTYKWLKDTLQSGGRYTIWFGWKGKTRAGHIVHVRKTSDGDVELYDPQVGIVKAKGKNEFKAYFSRVRYRLRLRSGTYVTPPGLLRVDDLYPNLNILNHVLKSGGGKK